MKTSINRELKFFANDLNAIRKILKSKKANLIEIKKQIDYFYYVPSKNYYLKLREEDGSQRLVYYYPTNRAGQRLVSFRVWKVNDNNIKDILDSILKAKGVVKKKEKNGQKMVGFFILIKWMELAIYLRLNLKRLIRKILKF